MYYFCTYFDHRYLTRGLSLYQSLKRHCPSFQLWVLCLDSTCYEILSQLALSNVHLISLEDFERNNEELLKAKQNRTNIEYYFTCTPFLPSFVLKNHPEVNIITYLDADLFFFSDPTPVFDEIADKSIAITPHRFPANFRHLEVYGTYNVGWLSFRHNKNAFECLHWWQERCVERCSTNYEEGHGADQKYLDNWSHLFHGVAIINHKGANLAPWNIANYKIHGKENCILVDEQPLIFFHFHGFKQIEDWVYNPNLAGFKVKLSRAMRRGIYVPYIRTMLDMNRQVSPLLQKKLQQNNKKSQMKESQLIIRIVKKFRTLVRIFIAIITRRYILEKG